MLCNPPSQQKVMHVTCQCISQHNDWCNGSDGTPGGYGLHEERAHAAGLCDASAADPGAQD